MIELLVKSFEHISKDNDVDRGEWETILEETKEHITTIKGNVSKHPKSISFRVTNY